MFVGCPPKAKQNQWEGERGWKNWREDDCVDYLWYATKFNIGDHFDHVIANDHIHGSEEDQDDCVDARRPDGQLDGVRGGVADRREEEAIAHSNKAWKKFLNSQIFAENNFGGNPDIVTLQKGDDPGE